MSDLAALVRHLLRGSNRQFFTTLEELGLSFTQVKTLGVLRDSETPLTVKAVSDNVGLSLPAVSRAVESLVRRGDVVRDEDPLDRRCKRVALTAGGRRTFDRLAELRLAGLRRFVDGLDEGLRADLAVALRPVVERGL